MAKKKFGKFVAFATVTGVVAAGISYFLRYKSFHDELNDEFHEFEDDDFDGELPHEHEAVQRTYVSLGDKKTETPVSTVAITSENAKEHTKVPAVSEDLSEQATEASAEKQPVTDPVSDTATTIVEDDTLDL